MEEELIQSEVNTPTEEVDLLPILSKLEDLVVKQGEIIKNQQKLIDYFIPTEEELIQLEKDRQEEQEQIKIQEEEQLSIDEQKQKDLLAYQDEVRTLLHRVVDNTSVGNEVSAVSSSTNYTLLVVVVSVLFFGLMYRVIKTFI